MDEYEVVLPDHEETTTVSVVCARLAVTPVGDLVVYGGRDIEPDTLAVAWAAGAWLSVHRVTVR